MLDYEIGCVLDYEWIHTSHQLCSIAYKCHIMSLTPKISIQIASVDVKETCCVCAIAMNSDESVAKGLVVQGRWEGHWCHVVGYGYRLATELTHLCVPYSDVLVLARTTCEESPIRWVHKTFIEMLLIGKVGRIKLGSVVIPGINAIIGNDSQAIGCQE